MKEAKKDKKKGKINRDDGQSGGKKPSIKDPITLLMLSHSEHSIWTHNHNVHQAQTSNWISPT